MKPDSNRRFHDLFIQIISWLGRHTTRRCDAAGRRNRSAFPYLLTTAQVVRVVAGNTYAHRRMGADSRGLYGTALASAGDERRGEGAMCQPLIRRELLR